MAQAERSEEHEEIHLGDAQLDVLTTRPRLPAQELPRRIEIGLGWLGPEDTDLVDPAAEIGRDRNVRRGRDDALAHLLDIGQLGQQATK